MDNISKQILESALRYEPLYAVLMQLYSTSKSGLEFFNKSEKKIGEFLQYTLGDIRLLDDEITVTMQSYGLFRETLVNVKETLIEFAPKRYNGELISVKNGIKYFFIYEYFYAYRDYLQAAGYIFKIWEKDKNSDNCFSFQLREMENGEDLKVVDLYPDSAKDYLGKGISIAIILKAKQIFNKRIISSSNKHKSHAGEFNTEEAKIKVWEPMVANRLAKYDVEKDFYYIL